MKIYQTDKKINTSYGAVDVQSRKNIPKYVRDCKNKKSCAKFPKT